MPVPGLAPPWPPPLARQPKRGQAPTRLRRPRASPLFAPRNPSWSQLAVHGCAESVGRHTGSAVRDWLDFQRKRCLSRVWLRPCRRLFVAASCPPAKKGTGTHSPAATASQSPFCTTQPVMEPIGSSRLRRICGPTHRERGPGLARFPKEKVPVPGLAPPLPPPLARQPKRGQAPTRLRRLRASPLFAPLTLWSCGKLRRLNRLFSVAPSRGREARSAVRDWLLFRRKRCLSRVWLRPCHRLLAAASRPPAKKKGQAPTRLRRLRASPLFAPLMRWSRGRSRNWRSWPGRPASRALAAIPVSRLRGSLPRCRAAGPPGPRGRWP